MLTTIPGSSVLYCDEQREDAPIRLFCFLPTINPNFVGWSNSLSEKNVECYYSSIKDMDLLSDQIMAHLAKPFIFLCYSNEATNVLQLVKKLKAKQNSLPRNILIINSNDLNCSKNEVIQIVKGSETLNVRVTILGSEIQEIKMKHDAAFIELISTEDKNEKMLNLFAVLNELLESEIETSRKESTELIEVWNSKKFEYPNDEVLHNLFVKSAKCFPNDVAVYYEGKTLTFLELDKMTDHLAAWLYNEGVNVGKTVGIFMDRCIGYAISYISALKAGGAYMPLEVVYPDDLLERALKEAKPVVVITSKKYHSRIPKFQKSLLFDEFDPKCIKTISSVPPLPENREQPNPDSLAYVVLSSGTTGVPKGICCPHRGAVHSYYYRLVTYPYSRGDREACNVFFVWEMLRPLLGGLKEAGNTPVPLYIIPDDVIYNPPHLVSYLKEHAITRMLFTPSLLQLVFDAIPEDELKKSLKAMRIIWLCGEVVTIELIEKALNILPHVQFENLYSISECHDISYANLNTLNTKESPKFAPCGKVIPNVKALILDDDFKQVPVGVPGRMYIEGPCLAIGYLNMPEKTAERFPDNIYRKGSRLYDTGDRSRYLPNGSIEVIGRCDYMVKIRGYSVVIGAVEAAISEHHLVSSSCVLTEGNEGSMEKKLIAYIVPENWEVLPSVQEIQDFVRSKIPPYAIPSIYILLESFPINLASGKLNRKKLPLSTSENIKKLPHFSKTVRSSTNGINKREELSEIEKVVAKVWAFVLNIEASTIYKESQFYDLGGHSLLLVKVASMIKIETKLEVSLAELVEFTSLKKLSRELEKKSDIATLSNLLCLSDDDLKDKIMKVWNEKLEDGTKDENSFKSPFNWKIFLADIKKDFFLKLPAGEFEAKELFKSQLKVIRGKIEEKLNDLKSCQGVLDLPLEVEKLLAQFNLTKVKEEKLVVLMPKSVLLTGATGFLGIQIMHRILLDTNVGLFCLVRAADENSAYERLRESLRKYKIFNETIDALLMTRVKVVIGDVSSPQFNLSEEQYHFLGEEIDSVIHSAAEVNLIKSYQDLRSTNVVGTKEVLQFSLSSADQNPKAVHFISTNGIFPTSLNSTVLSSNRPEDQDISDFWKILEDGYGQSKWVAERMCASLMEKGLPISILRCGNMGPSSESFAWNLSDFIFLALVACLSMESVPDASSKWKIDMTPVDFAARAIVHCTIADPSKSIGDVLHVQNPKTAIEFEKLLHWIKSANDKTFEKVSTCKFKQRLELRIQGSDLIAKAHAGFDSIDHFLGSCVNFGGKKLQGCLAGTGIHCPSIDGEFVGKLKFDC